MKIRTGLIIILLSIVVLSVFGHEDESALSSTKMILTKADANEYWDSLACK